MEFTQEVSLQGVEAPGLQGVFPTTIANTWQTAYQPSGKTGPLVYTAVSETPVIASGLRNIDMQKGYQLRVSSSVEDVQKGSFRACISTWGDSGLYNAGMSWIFAANNNEYGLQAGRFEGTETKTSTKIAFNPPFDKPPSVVAWITSFHIGCLQDWRLKAEVKDITATGFTLSVDKWGDTHLHTAAACWVAHPSDHPRVTSGVYSTDMIRKGKSPTTQTAGSSKFSKPFNRPPHVISAVSSFDASYQKNLRFNMPILQINNEDFYWSLDTWDDSLLNSASASYIAFDQKPFPSSASKPLPTAAPQPSVIMPSKEVPNLPVSGSLGGVGLGISAMLNKLGDTIVAIWDLTETGSKLPAKTDSLDYKNQEDMLAYRSIVGDDERERVAKNDLLSGGKYRSIVKLFIHYERQSEGQFAMSTGWLIKPDLIVTAGHCLFDWGHRMGRVTSVKAYIGYDGNASIDDPKAEVQFRRGVQVATSPEWMKQEGAKAADVGFIKVEKPFTGIIPIKYQDTPRTGQEVIGVVGYPGDLTDPATKEQGAFMYEMFINSKWDLTTAEQNMLQYEIDTFGGNSGSPVLLQKNMTSIGTHVYGGYINSASVIGLYGIIYPDYEAAFDMKLTTIATPGLTSTNGVKYVRVPTTDTIPSSAASATNSSATPVSNASTMAPTTEATCML